MNYDTFTDSTQVINYLLSLVNNIFGMTTSYYALTTDGRFRVLQALSLEEPILEAGVDIPLSESYCSYVAGSGEFMIIEDTRHDPRMAALAATTEVGIRSYVGAPIMLADGSVLGTLCALDRQPRAFQAEEIERLVTLARLIGFVLEQDQKIRDLTAAAAD